MRRLKAICSAAALATGFCLAAGSAPSYAATSSTSAAAADGPVINVIAGSDRYDTAIRVSQAGFPQGAPTVVIARGDDFPDALCAAPARPRLRWPPPADAARAASLRPS